jgi:DNA-binding transcriptional ArsR family regulator
MSLRLYGRGVEKPTTYVLDAASLKALAHPLRVRLLGLLREGGPSTATALGARLGESSGSASYHLRQLAAAGFVVEDTERGNARERWWRAAHQMTRLESTDWADEPETRAALDLYLGAVTAASAARVQEFLAEQDSWPKKWQAAFTVSDFSLSLTATELRRLNEAVEQLVESYRRPPRKGDELVTFQVQSFPRRRGSAP